MRIITTTPDLKALCDEFSSAAYVTVDTEFLREKTYWPILCLIQVARPLRPGEEAGQDAAIIDPMADGIELDAFWGLMANERVPKVFHAARQDLEIFLNLSGMLPTPLVDTQIAAMVCGFGDQVGYETLVREVAGEQIDKSSRFTDWSKRPLSERQLAYAIGDVTHLRVVHETLQARLQKAGRAGWLDEELARLSDPAHYVTEPAEAWRKIKTRSNSGKLLTILRELAHWREAEARRRNLTRNRVMRDEVLLELASLAPTSEKDLNRTRSLPGEYRKGAKARTILDLVAAGLAVPKEARPRPIQPYRPPPERAALGELMRVLLKARAAEAGVAPRLIATSADLDAIVGLEVPDVDALRGWRHEVFGEAALRLKRGEIALCSDGETVKIVEL